MASPTRNAFEAALQAALVALGVFKHVEVFEGPLLAILAQRTPQWPACWLLYQGAGYERQSQTSWLLRPQWSLLLAASSWRGVPESRQGAAGINVLVEAVQLGLLGQYLGLELTEPLQPVSDDLIILSDKSTGLSLSAIDFRWETSWTVRPATSPAEALLGLRAEFFLKPGDDILDAADELEPE